MTKIKNATISSKRFLVICLLLSFVSVQFLNAQNLAGGVEPFTKAEYDSFPKDDESRLPMRAPGYTDPDDGDRDPSGSSELRTHYLINPLPVAGDQGNTLSCLGWALSTAVGIMTNYEYRDWEKARRSPSFVYNRLNPGTNCGYTNIGRGMRLLDSIGVCSYNSMPYIAGNCSAQPGDLQYLEAEMHKTSGWRVANDTASSSYIRKYLDLGYPLVITFPVTPSFDNMWNTSNPQQRGLWDKFSTSETVRGLHAACVVGYEVYEEKNAYGQIIESELMFKVMNFWGTNGGNNGYFYLPAETVERGALRGIFRPTGVNITKITGNKIIDEKAEYNYEIENLPSFVSIDWGSSSNLTLISDQGFSDADFYPDKNGYASVNATLSRGNASVNLELDSIFVNVAPKWEFTITPNPATSYIHVQIRKEAGVSDGESSKRPGGRPGHSPGIIYKLYTGVYTAIIYNSNGTLAKQQTNYSTVENISVSDLTKNRTYYVRIILEDGTVLSSQSLIVK